MSYNKNEKIYIKQMCSTDNFANTFTKSLRKSIFEKIVYGITIRYFTRLLSWLSEGVLFCERRKSIAILDMCALFSFLFWLDFSTEFLLTKVFNEVVLKYIQCALWYVKFCFFCLSFYPTKFSLIKIKYNYHEMIDFQYSIVVYDYPLNYLNQCNHKPHYKCLDYASRVFVCHLHILNNQAIKDFELGMYLFTYLR